MKATAAAIGALPAVAAEQSGTKSGPARSKQPVTKSDIAFPRVHTGRQLARISCPLGGIGTGGIGLGGRGNLQDWEVFNRPQIGNVPEFAFPSMWVQRPGSAPYAVVLERRLLPPYDLYPEGLGAANVPGLPRLAEARFIGSFPVSRIEWDDADCPVNVALDAFSPFQPLDADASGLPCAVLTYEVRNPGASAAEVVVAWSITNPLGGSAGRKNEHRTTAGLSGLVMTDPSLDAADPLHGSFVISAPTESAAKVEMLTEWRAGNTWRDGPQHFWFDAFAKTGGLGLLSQPSTPVGSLSIRQTIPAGATRSFRFLLTWHFPNRTPARCGWGAPQGQNDVPIGNFYCTRHADAWAVAEYLAANLDGLERRTREFVSAMKRSTLPDAVKEAATANLTTLVSNTSFRIANGSFQGFEGCGDGGGYGYGTCTHVWNYEVATQFLFPTLARSMRETSFGHDVDVEGHMDFRHKLPLSAEQWGGAAADGQMGQIVKLYFDWTLTGDDEWLRKYWLSAKRALGYAWRFGGWDARQSGVMDGVQHNTYDIEFYGPNPMCGTWYLAALRAMALMADAMGDPDLAQNCRRMEERGSGWIDANLFTGEYYIQQVRSIARNKIAAGLQQGLGATDSLQPQFQVGDGCLVDQLIGQYMATIAGLGPLLNPAHIRTTLESIYRYNYKRSLAHHASVERVYALNDEAGLVICDYTKGTRPDIPMPYYAEVMTGFEYATAALMMANGMIAEGVECYGNVRRRYDGEKANPFCETEYGRHYARAMASWAAIPVLSGFRYDAKKSRMELAPKVNADRFQCFWSAPVAWGSFAMTPGSVRVSVSAGTISLKELMVAPALRNARGALKVTAGDAEVAHTVAASAEGSEIRFAQGVTVDAKTPLQLKA